MSALAGGKMGSWIGYLGAGDPATLAAALGSGARVAGGPGFSVGVRQGPGEPVRLTAGADGGGSVEIGCADTAGCAAAFAANGRELRLSDDPFGHFGVYLRETAGTLWCASDPRLLASLPDGLARLDASALHGYL